MVGRPSAHPRNNPGIHKRRRSITNNNNSTFTNPTTPSNKKTKSISSSSLQSPNIKKTVIMKNQQQQQQHQQDQDNKNIPTMIPYVIEPLPFENESKLIVKRYAEKMSFSNNNKKDNEKEEDAWRTIVLSTLRYGTDFDVSMILNTNNNSSSSIVKNHNLDKRSMNVDYFYYVFFLLFVILSIIAVTVAVSVTIPLQPAAPTLKIQMMNK